MRIGPGKHMHGVDLMGVMKGEEFDVSPTENNSSGPSLKSSSIFMIRSSLRKWFAQMLVDSKMATWLA